MDFRICPSCEQSVLDDDVEDCPFCGNSMSGKAKPKPAKPKPSQPAAKSPSQEVASPSAKKTPAPASKATPAETPKSEKQAATSSRKPPRIKGSLTTSCRYEVQCPMCETVGFVPESYIGKEVQCRNKECLVPLFNVPEPEKEEEPLPPSFIAKYGIILAVLAVLILGTGGGIFYIASQEAPKDKKDPPPPPKVIVDKDKDKEENGDPVIPEVTPKKQTDWKSIQEKLIAQILRQKRFADKNRDHKILRQIAAQAHSLNQQPEKALAEIDQLSQDSSTPAFSKIRPLTELTWRALENKKQADAKAYLKDALIAAKSLPATGEESSFLASRLAASLIAVENTTQADALIQKHQENSADSQWGCTLQIVLASNTFDTNAESRIRSIVPQNYPLSSAVVRTLFARGYHSQAIQWCSQRKNPQEQQECRLAILTEQLLQEHASKDNPENQSPRFPTIWAALGSQCTSAQKAEVFALRAKIYTQFKNMTAAKNELQKAKKQLEAVSLPAVVELPSMRAIYAGEFQKINTVDLLSAVSACDLMFSSQAAIDPQNKEDIWKTIDQGIQFAQRLGTPAEKVEALVATATTQKDATRNSLKKLLKLNTDADARRAFNQYRPNLDQLKKASDQRQELVSSLLVTATDWGLGVDVWKKVKSAEGVFSEGDSLMKTKLSGILLVTLQTLGEADLVKEIQDQADSNPLVYSFSWQMAHDIKAKLKLLSKKDSLETITKSLQNRRLTRIEQRQLSVNTICQLAETGDASKTLSLISKQKSPLLREQALLLVGGQLATTESAGELIKSISRGGFSETEKAFGFLGVLYKVKTLSSQP